MYLTRYARIVAKEILIKFPKRIGYFFVYLRQFFLFKNDKRNRFETRWADMYPCLNDKLTITPFDAHYTYHPAWAARILAKTMPKEHVDISSILHFSSITSAFLPIKFYDYRPVLLNLPNYQSEFADLTQLPFPDNSIESLSCMHTIEHIGLGRYGDPLDPEGDLKAISELKRVLKPGGQFLFVTPVGKPRIEFNAHRVYSFEMVKELWEPLELREFSLVDDQNKFIQNADPEIVKTQHYGCGCFWFTK